MVDVPEEVQIERSVGLRGLDEADVERRMQAQATREQRLSIADVVVDNSGSMADLAEQVDELWTWLNSGEGVPPAAH